MSLCVLSFAVVLFSSFFFTVPATTGIYTLSLHDALPIYPRRRATGALGKSHQLAAGLVVAHDMIQTCRSEEHTSELQSLRHLVCRLLLEKKKKKQLFRHKPRRQVPLRYYCHITINEDTSN